MRVVLLVEQLEQAARAHGDADALIGVTAQVRGQPVILEIVGNQHDFPGGSHHVRARQEIPIVDLTACHQVAHGDFEQLYDLALRVRALQRLAEGFVRRAQHIHVHARHGPEAAALYENGVAV